MVSRIAQQIGADIAKKMKAAASDINKQRPAQKKPAKQERSSTPATSNNNAGNDRSLFAYLNSSADDGGNRDDLSLFAAMGRGSCPDVW